MSLINDALKRARQAAPPPVPAPASAPDMTPIESRRPPQWPLVAVPVLLLGVVVVAVWFFWHASQISRQFLAAQTQTRVAAREETKASKASEPSTPENPEQRGPAEQAFVTSTPQARPTPASSTAAPTGTVSSSPANGAASGATTSAAFAPTNAVSVTLSAAGPLKPATPPLKLQAIFYRPNNATAVINSKAVRRGDKISEARVLQIGRESVTLWINGQTNVLTLP
jgi:hypothetical protein